MELADAPELAPEVFDVRQMIDDSARRFAVLAREKGLALEIKTASTVPPQAIGEATWLREVLTGLLDNAVRFTDRGEVVASVTSTETAGTRTLLHAEVSDTGCGMPAEVVEDVFGPHTRGGPPSVASDGSCSSLQVAQRLVELMDGRLGGSSALGMGTTAWFTVPLDLP